MLLKIQEKDSLCGLKWIHKVFKTNTKKNLTPSLELTISLSHKDYEKKC